MNNDFIINNLESVDPSPIAPRKCKCGCGNTFQPRRYDQVFINKQHADHYHYHMVKKPKRKVQNEIEKIHRKNDRICAKYVNANDGDPVDCNWESVLADGLDHKYMQGYIIEDEVKYILTYNYMFTIYKENEIVKIKIKKR